MEDKFRIDSHKLIFHPERVSQWKMGNMIYPIYMEISPAGPCNHRCIFCAFDYLDYKPVFIETKKINQILTELSKLGLKSVMYAGEGEPFLHKDMVNIIEHTKNVGIDVAVASNGVLWTKEKIEKTIPKMTWIRISLNAGSKEDYLKIHRGRETDWDTLFNNLKYACDYKSKTNSECTIGAQFLLLRENYKNLGALAEKLSDIGLNYLTIKPFVQHLSSGNVIAPNFTNEELIAIQKQAEKYTNERFKVIFRANAIEKLDRVSRGYKKCWGIDFFAEIVSNGNVYTCGPFLGNEKFCYGNIYESSFKQIWEGEKRKQVLDFFENQLNVDDCMKNCRLDEINKYLWELKNPGTHVNFI